MIRKGRLILALPFFLGLIALGCGKGNPHAPAKVTGTVTYKGNTVTAGEVVFHNKEGSGGSAAIRPDGTYVLTDVAIGEMQVTVETESANPNVKQPEYKGSKGGPLGKKGGGPSFKGKAKGSPKPGDATAAEGTYTKIPAKYADKDKSGLKVTLKRGDNKYDIPLTD